LHASSLKAPSISLYWELLAAIISYYKTAFVCIKQMNKNTLLVNNKLNGYRFITVGMDIKEKV